MPIRNPDDVAAKWASNLSAATNQIKAGVQAVSVSPTAKAAQNSAGYLNGVQAAVASGKWQRGLQRVSLQQWQDAMINKGAPRVASGATQAKPKFSAFMQQWLPYMDQLQQRLQSQPRGDLQTNIQRAVTAMEFAAAFRRQ